MMKSTSLHPSFHTYRIVGNCFFALLVLATASKTFGEDPFWPGWLGPGRDGQVKDFVAPNSWPDKVQEVWRVNIGTGYGSPLVVGSKVFQHARQGEEELLACLSLASGEILWQQNVPVPFKMGGGGEWHGKGPKSCPFYSDGKVFTMSISGTLSAWDAETGKKLWSKDYNATFQPSHPYWGHSTSPIGSEGRIFVHFGNDKSGALVCLSADSGNEEWKLEGSGASYSSPLLGQIHGQTQLIEWNHDALIGVAPKTGEVLWSFSLPHVGTDQNMPTPSVRDGYILVGGENRGVRRVDIQVENGSWSATEVWHQKEVALDMSSAIAVGDLLYGFSHYDKGRIFCLAPDTGEIRWTSPPRTGQNVTFLATPGHVFALLDSGELRVIQATGSKYIPLASYQVSDDPTWAPPVLLPNGFLIKDRKSIALIKFIDK